MSFKGSPACRSRVHRHVDQGSAARQIGYAVVRYGGDSRQIFRPQPQLRVRSNTGRTNENRTGDGRIASKMLAFAPGFHRLRRRITGYAACIRSTSARIIRHTWEMHGCSGRNDNETGQRAGHQPRWVDQRYPNVHLYLSAVALSPPSSSA